MTEQQEQPAQTPAEAEQTPAAEAAPAETAPEPADSQPAAAESAPAPAAEQTAAAPAEPQAAATTAAPAAAAATGAAAAETAAAAATSSTAAAEEYVRMYRARLAEMEAAGQLTPEQLAQHKKHIDDYEAKLNQCKQAAPAAAAAAAAGAPAAGYDQSAYAAYYGQQPQMAGAPAGPAGPYGYAQPQAQPANMANMPSTEGKLRGTVAKWISEKGFGFIKTADGQDLFCHKKEILNSGAQGELEPGLEVYYDMVDDPKSDKKCAANVFGPGVRFRGMGRTPDGRLNGVVVNWHAERGFGFIKTEEGDLFCHQKNLNGASLIENCDVTCEMHVNEGKKVAVNVVGPGVQMPPPMGGYGGYGGPPHGYGGYGAPGYGYGGYGAPPPEMHAPRMGGGRDMGRGPRGGGIGPGGRRNHPEGPARGAIKTWNHEKGFGFIQCNDGVHEVFCHKKHTGNIDLPVGTEVAYTVVPDSMSSGVVAQSVSVVSSGNGGGAPSGRDRDDYPRGGY